MDLSCRTSGTALRRCRSSEIVLVQKMSVRPGVLSNSSRDEFRRAS